MRKRFSPYDTGKRAIDVAVSATALVVLSPVLAVIAMLVRLTLGTGVFFRQERVGRGGVVFSLVKFRTMKPDERAAAGPEHDAERLTRLGRFLRSTSLDELPTLWNVFQGEMSLVGPRPLPVRYLPRYTENQMHRHDVPVGVTGWAQINGRNALSWEERLELDLWYVAHRSLGLDMKILLRTALRVLQRDGVTTESGEAMPEFLGVTGGLHE